MPSPMEASAVEDMVPILAEEGHRVPQPQSRRLRLVAPAAAALAALAALALAARGASSRGAAPRPSAAQGLFHAAAGLGGHRAASAGELPLISEAEDPLEAGSSDWSSEDLLAVDPSANTGTTTPPSKQFPSARQEKDPDAPLLLATDGTEFKFSVKVDSSGLGTWPTAKDIIEDSGGAFFFLLREGKVEFVMQTLNGGEVHVDGKLVKDEMNAVTVFKDDKVLCLTTGTSGAEPTCKKTDQQMKIPGDLRWNVIDKVAKDFVQLEGGVSLSLTANGIAHEKLHGQPLAYLNFANAVKSSVALVGGFGVGKTDVLVSHSAGSVLGSSSTSVHVTAAKLGANAPHVHQRLLAAVPAATPNARARRLSAAIADDEKEAALNAELEKRINAIPNLDDIAAAPGEKVTVDDTAVPAEPVNCDAFDCGPFREVLSGQTCVGGGCGSVCCGPRSCREIACAANSTNANDATATCSDKLSCEANCCEKTCTGKCSMDSCPNFDAKGKTVKTADYTTECCITPPQPCCQEKTVGCLSCKVCMEPTEFCEAVIARSLLNSTGLGDSARRLKGQHGSGNARMAFDLDEARPASTFDLGEEMLKKKAEERGSADEWTFETFNNYTENLLDRYAEDVPPGCKLDPLIPTCSWSLRSTFTPKDGNHGPATTVSVLKAGGRAIFGAQQSGNLYMFNLATGQPDIPFKRHAEGTLQEYGILVVGVVAENGAVSASALMLDGQQGAVGYDKGKIVTFNVGDIYYPPTREDPAAESLFDAKVNSIASMPSWDTMLLAMGSGWTLMYQYSNGGTIRFPRNFSTQSESIALRQQLIKNAFDARFATGSSPPEEDETKQFYTEIAEKFKKDEPAVANINEAVQASWTNTAYTDYPVNAVVYVPISTKFATAHGDGKVRYWQSISGTQLYQMKGHQGAVNCLAAHPTKEIVASGGNDATVRVWLFTGAGEQILLFNQTSGGPVRSLAFLPGGNTLVAGSDDGILRRYDMRRGELQCSTPTFAGATTTMSADPALAGQIVIGTGSGTAMVYN